MKSKSYVFTIKEKIATNGQHVDALNILALTAGNEFSMQATEASDQFTEVYIMRYVAVYVNVLCIIEASVDACAEGDMSTER